MPNTPKQPGDAVLSRDGTVKVDGRRIGFWWIEANDIYQFDFKRPDDPLSAWGVVSHPMRVFFKADIRKYLDNGYRRPAI